MRAKPSKAKVKRGKISHRCTTRWRCPSYSSLCRTHWARPCFPGFPGFFSDARFLRRDAYLRHGTTCVCTWLPQTMCSISPLYTRPELRVCTALARPISRSQLGLRLINLCLDLFDCQHLFFHLFPEQKLTFLQRQTFCNVQPHQLPDPLVRPRRQRRPLREVDDGR